MKLSSLSFVPVPCSRTLHPPSAATMLARAQPVTATSAAATVPLLPPGKQGAAWQRTDRTTRQ